jgi:phosphate transport system substrate-binding protein
MLVVLLLGGCLSQPSAAPTFPVIGHIVATPYLESLVAGWMGQYADQHGPPPFDLDTLPRAAGLERVDAGQADLLVTFGEPPEDWFATPLPSQGIAIIVNPENPADSLTLEQLGGLYTGRIGDWEEVGESEGAVQPVIPLPGDDFRSQFEALVQRGTSAASSSLHAPQPEAMILAVAQDKAAVGYIPLRLVSPKVRMIRVEGILPGDSTLADGRYTLVARITATAPKEPHGAVRDWLAWVQAEIMPSP